jgi:hypothetical protein
MTAIAPPTPRRSAIPAIVVLVCFPLLAVTALMLFALALESVNKPLAMMLGFASVFGYLVTFLPALVLAEPFAIGASIWYTRQFTSRTDESFGSVLACWGAVLVHTAAIAFYLRRGWR